MQQQMQSQPQQLQLQQAEEGPSQLATAAESRAPDAPHPPPSHVVLRLLRLPQLEDAWLRAAELVRTDRDLNVDADARAAVRLDWSAAEVLVVRSPVDESNAALAHPLGSAGGPVAYAYATKQGRVRLLELGGRAALGAAARRAAELTASGRLGEAGSAFERGRNAGDGMELLDA
jgi:hypothetical protein